LDPNDPLPARSVPNEPFPRRKRFASLNVMLGVLWSILTLPFRVIAWVVEFCGRLVGLGMGFLLMVLGVALGAGPFFIIGIPIFVIGLILTLRSLG
jgi:hypothetical protein